jgi:cell division protein FtsQ
MTARTRTRRTATAKRAAPGVRVRRTGTRPAPRENRGPRGRRFAVVASAVLLVIGIAAAVALAPRWGRGSDEFRLATIDVRGNVVLTDEEVTSLSGLANGMNLLAVSVPAVERALASSPRVDRAQALRLLPDRVLIRLSEKLPVALVETPEGPVEVAADLTVLPSVARTPGVDVPVVTGARVDLEAGAKVEDEGLVGALELLARARAISGALWMDISEVRIAPGSGLIIYTVADGAEVRVGSGALDSNGLRRLALVLDDLRARGAAAASIDLRFRHQVVVRTRSGAARGHV